MGIPPYPMPQGQPMPQAQMVQQTGNPNGYHAPAKKRSSKLGLFSMILGITSLLLFAVGVNYPLLTASIILGIIHLVKKGKPSMAITGIVTSVLSFLLSIVLWIAVIFTGVGDAVQNVTPGGGYDGYYDYFDDLENLDSYDNYL